MERLSVLAFWGVATSGWLWAREAASKRAVPYAEALAEGEALVAQGEGFAAAALAAFDRALKLRSGLGGWCATMGMALNQTHSHQLLREYLGRSNALLEMGKLEEAENAAIEAVVLGPGDDGAKQGRRPPELLGLLSRATLYVLAVHVRLNVQLARSEERCAAGDWKQAKNYVDMVDRHMGGPDADIFTSRHCGELATDSEVERGGSGGRARRSPGSLRR